MSTSHIIDIEVNSIDDGETSIFEGSGSKAPGAPVEKVRNLCSSWYHLIVGRVRRNALRVLDTRAIIRIRCVTLFDHQNTDSDEELSS
ncbi:hypothetical protein C0991_010635 [Blastosporella zonata]|nr:hypothetical protein C0991_010635 [Blastosporella zonata]